MENITEERSAKAGEWQPLPGVDRNCFGCGFENDHGLGMKFETNGVSIRSSLEVPERFRGWSNLIHGGILATILDEAMSWAAIYLTSRFILTKGMRVDFIKPVRVGMKLQVTGFVKERLDERRSVVCGEIRDTAGELLASSEGEFVLFTRKQFLKMRIVPEADLELMSALIRE